MEKIAKVTNLKKNKNKTSVCVWEGFEISLYFFFFTENAIVTQLLQMQCNHFGFLLL